MPRILLSAITFEANHGVTSAERAGTRQFEVDVVADWKIAEAERSDRLGDTMDYSEIADIVVKAGTSEAHHLLESVARKMLDRLTERFPGARFELELRKLSPPACAGHPRFAGVRLHSE